VSGSKFEIAGLVGWLSWRSVYLSKQVLLQCVAVCCRVLQCVAVCCGVLQCVVGALCIFLNRSCCSVLQSIAVCCSVLQCVAVCCRVLQCVAGCS